MTSRYRPRRQFKFLLYQDVPMEQVLTDFIARLKKERKFVTVIKAALRLYGSLQEHDLSVLYELFPWIGSAIKADLPPSPKPDNSDMQQQISAAVATGVQQALLQLPPIPAAPLGYPALKSNTSAPPPKVETKAAPVMSASDIADNFFLSMGQG